MIVRDAIPRFITSLHAAGSSLNTIRSYRWDLNQLGQLASIDCGNVQFDDLADFLRFYGAGRSVASQNRMKSSLKAFFDYLVEAGHIKKLPFRKLPHAKVIRPRA